MVYPGKKIYIIAIVARIRTKIVMVYREVENKVVLSVAYSYKNCYGLSFISYYITKK